MTSVSGGTFGEALLMAVLPWALSDVHEFGHVHDSANSALVVNVEDLADVGQVLSSAKLMASTASLP